MFLELREVIKVLMYKIVNIYIGLVVVGICYVEWMSG